MTIPASELRVSVAKIICNEADTVMFATTGILADPLAFRTNPQETLNMGPQGLEPKGGHQGTHSI